jgi:hypothetical protein
MITVRLKGGLGNQMFQYALGRVLAIKNSAELKLDTSFLSLNFKSITKRTYNLDVFNIKAEITHSSYLISILRRIFKSRGQEKSFQFDKNILSIGGEAYLDGYWQSPKYFERLEDMLKKDFILKNPLTHNTKILAEEIKNSNSLCVHVRRGDYVGNKNHEVTDKDYYTRGIEYIKNHTQIDKIYVFSDDINWCRNNLSFEFPVMFVDNNYAGIYGEEHMYLMSKCKNFIIANSSFSWWGAWLSEYKDKIIVCPKQWFPDASVSTNDLIPESWVRI